MIVSVNSKPEISEFRKLMAKTDQLLNADALKRPKYYASRGGNPLEDDVKAALDECAKGTAFQGTIEKISGHRFPDIVAAKFYGVEVKSTKDDHWTSTGSSIMETTRVTDVERIFMTFGKLGGNPIEFMSKPYEECLYGIAVTHMPRYLIDMRLKPGQTIFDKMGIDYDTLRQMDNPIAPVSSYYRKHLKPGESLWWAGDTADETVSATIRLWKNLKLDEKRRYTVFGCVNYPEIFGGDYDRYSLWLTSQGVVDPHIRDQFSAGGQEEMRMPDGQSIKFPGVYRRVKNNIDYFLRLMALKDSPVTIESTPVQGEVLKKRLLAWCDAVSRSTNMDYNLSMDALSEMFFHTSHEKAKASQMKAYYGREGWQNIQCSHCGKVYHSLLSRQREGLREREDNTCPYCGKSNGSSMEWEFYNIK